MPPFLVLLGNPGLKPATSPWGGKSDINSRRSDRALKRGRLEKFSLFHPARCPAACPNVRALPVDIPGTERQSSPATSSSDAKCRALGATGKATPASNNTKFLLMKLAV